jgi:hypothetical protein
MAALHLRVLRKPATLHLARGGLVRAVSGERMIAHPPP